VSCRDVLRVQGAAALQRQASAADARVQTVTQGFESFDLLVETLPPSVRDLRPVGARGSARLRQSHEGLFDLIEGQSNMARSADEGETAQHDPFVSSLAPRGSVGSDQTLAFVEPQCRRRESTSPCDLCNG
jgi:hypothetical protein